MYISPPPPPFVASANFRSDVYDACLLLLPLCVYVDGRIVFGSCLYCMWIGDCVWLLLIIYVDGDFVWLLFIMYEDG